MKSLLENHLDCGRSTLCLAIRLVPTYRAWLERAFPGSASKFLGHFIHNLALVSNPRPRPLTPQISITVKLMLHTTRLTTYLSLPTYLGRYLHMVRTELEYYTVPSLWLGLLMGPGLSSSFGIPPA